MWRWYNKLTYPYIFLWLFDFLIFFFLIYNLHMIIQVVCLHYFQNNHNQKKKKRPTYNIHLFSLDSWLSVQWFEWRDKVLKKILVENKVTCFLLDHMQFPQVSEEEKKKSLGYFWGFPSHLSPVLATQTVITGQWPQSHRSLF